MKSFFNAALAEFLLCAIRATTTLKVFLTATPFPSHLICLVLFAAKQILCSAEDEETLPEKL